MTGWCARCALEEIAANGAFVEGSADQSLDPLRVVAG